MADSKEETTGRNCRNDADSAEATTVPDSTSS